MSRRKTPFGGAAILAVGAILVKLIGAPYKGTLGNILSNDFTDFNTDLIMSTTCF